MYSFVWEGMSLVGNEYYPQMYKRFDGEVKKIKKNNLKSSQKIKKKVKFVIVCGENLNIKFNLFGG